MEDQWAAYHHLSWNLLYDTNHLMTSRVIPGFSSWQLVMAWLQFQFQLKSYEHFYPQLKSMIVFAWQRRFSMVLPWFQPWEKLGHFLAADLVELRLFADLWHSVGEFFGRSRYPGLGGFNHPSHGRSKTRTRKSLVWLGFSRCSPSICWDDTYIYLYLEFFLAC